MVFGPARDTWPFNTILTESNWRSAAPALIRPMSPSKHHVDPDVSTLNHVADPVAAAVPPTTPFRISVPADAVPAHAVASKVRVTNRVVVAPFPAGWVPV